VIAVTVVAFVLTRVSNDLEETLFFNLAQINPLVLRGEWWRIFTPILVHGSAAHIAFNMFALYQLGPAVEIRYGRVNFLLLYLGAAAAGGAFAFHLGGEGDALVGASGAIFGLFGLWLDSAFRQRDTAFGRSLLSSLWISLALNIALPFILPGISWQGHLGGLLAGIVVGEFWARAPRQLYWMTPLAVAVAAVASLIV
jgi:membrane associated rhomboid family serine protease